MAGYRQFHTKFWKDGWVIELEPLERYLFTYLFTNEQSSISGIFELPIRIIQNETGLDKSFILATLDKFEKSQKILYRDGIVWVVKMRIHHKNMSPTTSARVNADVASIPEGIVKQAYRYYQETGIYSIDTVSEEYPYPSLKAKDKAKDKAEAEVSPPPPPDPSEKNIYRFYSDEIGTITPMVSDDLQLAEKEYPAGWIEDAIREAVNHNARSWKYCETILKRWKVEGKKENKNGHKSEDAPASEWVTEGGGTYL